MSIDRKSSPAQRTLFLGVDYVGKMLDHRLTQRLHPEQVGTIEPLRLSPDGSALSHYISAHFLSLPEQLILFLALTPEVEPGLLESLLRRHLPAEGDLPAFGGIRGRQFRGILPTGQTCLFLLAGCDPVRQLNMRELLSPHGKLFRSGVVKLLPPPPGEPEMAGQLIADPEFVERILTGRVAHPAFSPAFPAQLLETDLEWSDLVLPQRSLREIAYLRHYLDHHERLAGDPAYGRHSRRGYRALFHGPPGTGKTLTATLLGKAVNKPVFRVDLSMVVSKWIGETEKNLSGLFDRAESKGWILFFDEADALFSKRSEVKESRDKYANQETSFLLQRVENYDGLCILATNFRHNLDKAFTRRFEATVPFTAPDAAERLTLWNNMLPSGLPPHDDIVINRIAQDYELNGASIANALRHAIYEAVAAGEKSLGSARLVSAIRREYEKEDRLFPDPNT